MIALLEEGLEWVLISGQLGTELWAAEVAFRCRKNFPT
ncbi:SLOG family protein [Bacillus licheniformis]|nr:SLOG family protein [Bacillus licheniformis]